MKDWWLDERSFAGREHLDEAFVEGYDAKAQVDPTADVELLRSLGLDESSSVLELGAGTGVLSLAVAPFAGAVTAVDVSNVMTATIRRKLAENALANVTVVEAGFLTYEHRGVPPDFVYTRNALHQLPDLWKVVALSRIAALMAPHGVLLVRDLVFDLEPADVETGVEAWAAGAMAEDPRKGYTRADLAEHVRTEFSTYTWLFEAMLERTGFEILDKVVRRSTYADYTCRLRR